MAHPNALCIRARMRIVELVIEKRWPKAHAAALMGVSRHTVRKWVDRFQTEGLEGLRDRSSAPLRTPHALDELAIETILALRSDLAVGPHRLAHQLKMAQSTIYGVLKRHGVSNLRRLDRTTREIIRYERPAPGDLLHIDVKKLGRIPEGGGWRFKPLDAPRTSGRMGHEYVHVAVDDHSRFAYVDVLPDERGETCAAFLERAYTAFGAQGVRVARVLTDNAPSYYSRAFLGTATSLGIGLRKTRPRHPQTNGKAERFIRILLQEWAYLREYGSNHERLLALDRFIADYNHIRPHGGIGFEPPASRLSTT
jgi:transposase InsO family protein